jgi:hypothetical protein
MTLEKSSSIYESDDEADPWDSEGPISPIPAQTDMKDLKRDGRSLRFDKSIINEIEAIRPTGYDYDIWQQFATVRDINYAFLRNQARYFCVYSLAPLGVGKTSYAIQCLQQLYGEYDQDGFLVKANDDWELIKAHIIFHPQTFKQIVQHLQKTKTRIKALVWDDSGIFLSAKDWQKKWAREIVKYFQLARTYCASIILTTPSPSLILRDIRRMNMVTINIEFAKSQYDHLASQHAARRARSYDHWYLPDLKKTRVRYRGTDTYNVMLPNKVYDPYQLMRATYADFELEQVFEIIGEEGKDLVGDINLDKLAPMRGD